MRLSAWMLGIALLTLVAGTAAAQQRPTLSEAEARIDVLEAEVESLETALGVAEVEVERNRDAMCVRADVLGETYRPLVCDPRCDCFDVTELGYPQPGVSLSCSEDAPGDFTISGINDLGSCDSNLCTGSPGRCMAGGSGTSCTTFDDCQPGEVCDMGGFGFGSCRIPCTTQADCPPLAAICSGSSLTTCASAEDCGLDQICVFAAELGTVCIRGCGSDAGCSVARPVLLEGLVGPNDPAAITCTDQTNPLVFETSLISPNDAIQCLAQVEAAAGISCAYLCGDGGIDPGETCDDGNTTPGDGCDASCQVES